MAAAEGGFERKSLFKRYVQIGRLCVISKGAEEGKICTIVDVVDKNRVRHLVFSVSINHVDM